MQKNSEKISTYIKNLNIEDLNEIQNLCLEKLKKHDDLILLSPTGSGKTLAFLLPSIEFLNPKNEFIQILILVPSRELAMQIEQVLKKMKCDFKVNSCYGGHSMRVEYNNLGNPPSILIGTPGRIADHLKRRNFGTNSIQTLILDEFDKSLELGFKTDMEFIISELPNLKKRFLTSATKMNEIPEFTGIKNAFELNFLNDSAPKIKFKKVLATGNDKLDALFRLICKLGNESMLIFCNHREAVERISKLLNDKNLVHEMFHGGMEQEERERALLKFRNGSHNLLITTDLASRGLDIPEIKYIVHYQLPLDENSFIHRNGRTARMNAEGTSYLVLSENEIIPNFIDLNLEIENLPENVVLPKTNDWITLYFGAGKKNKINKIDIVGLLIQKGQLLKEEIGIIEVYDFTAYVAIKREKTNSVLKLIKNEQIKKQWVKVDISR
jgi:ATP-independent RNA helicase DbpA